MCAKPGQTLDLCLVFYLFRLRHPASQPPYPAWEQWHLVLLWTRTTRLALVLSTFNNSQSPPAIVKDATLFPRIEIF